MNRPNLLQLRRTATALTLSALALALPAQADGPSFAIRAGRVMPVADGMPWVIENGIVIVRDGRIEAVGKNLSIPTDLNVVDMPDAVIVPGFVAASSGLAGQHSGDESIGAAYRALDAFDVYGDYRTTLATGVTTAHLNPGWHRLVSGHGAVVRLGAATDARIVRADADLTVNLGPAAANPPSILELTIPPSPDQDINPARPQRPGSRMTQFLALKEALADGGPDAKYTVHGAAFRRAWDANATMRIQAQSAVDLAGAVAFLGGQRRSGYLVGGLDAAAMADQIAASGLPLVYTLDPDLRRPGSDLGDDPATRERTLHDLAELAGVKQLALGLANNQPLSDLRLAAALAQRSGLGERRILEAITRVPAEILGLGDEIGSLAPGHRADLLIMTGHPLETASSVQRVYVDGHLAYSAPQGNALVVRAGTVWLGPGNWLRDGEILIEDGRITEVGGRVGRPPNARVVNAGPDAFVTPGLIDAHGHLGLGGDRGSTGPNLSLARLLGPPDLSDERVARAGVTSVMLSPYGFGGAGSQVTAIKTAGATRDARVLRRTAAVGFTAGDDDAASIPNRFRSRLGQAKAYVDKWEKYEKDLEEWKKKRAEGKLEPVKPKIETTTDEGAKADPVTGTWSVTISGGPLPEPQTARAVLKLNGTSIEGRLLDAPVPGDVRITGELDGKNVRGEIELDTGGMGVPTYEGTIVEEDLCRGTAGIGGMIEVDFEMRRTDKKAVEFKVSRTRRTTGKDGRPVPPDIDESLEPLRALLAGKIPIVVNVTGRLQIDAVLDVLLDEFKLPVVLLNGDEAHRHAERLKAGGVGVVLPPEVMRRERNAWYHQGVDLNRKGIDVAFQSDAEDGARTLRDVGFYAVSQGLSPEAALGALTINAAKMYRLDDRIGSIAPGRDGDLVIFSGFPFDADAAVERVIINGEEVRP